jgi:O-acetyl-ADP-ribose deacetylase (regulator of RNase III)
MPRGKETPKMKIVTKTGNLLDVTAGHIVHGCNAQGVMGSGVALAVKKMYPGAYLDYLQIHEDEGLDLGVAYPYIPKDGLVIWNAITQDGFGLPTRNCSYDAIQTCFEDINTAITAGVDLGIIPEIHIPAIGAGLGGGNWEIIREIIEQTCTVPVTLWVLPS